MSIGRITSLLRNKENIHLEFKKAHEVLPSNLFESICAMLNREGGDILLGVSASGIQPQFIEGDVFKTIIPLNGVKSGINEGINGGLNSGINEGQQKVFKIIRENEGIKAKEISVRLNIPVDTIDKHIKVLKTKKLIYHYGSKKTGGYFFEDKT
jgi:predicted HTH transcriptional regulator